MADNEAAIESLIASIRQAESGGNSNPDVASSQGAVGSMQITPRTFSDYAAPGERFDNPVDRERAAVRKIRADYAYYDGDPHKTAAAYLGGRGAVLPDGTIRDDVADANGTTPRAYAEKVTGTPAPEGKDSPYFDVPVSGAPGAFHAEGTSSPYFDVTKDTIRIDRTPLTPPAPAKKTSLTDDVKAAGSNVVAGLASLWKMAGEAGQAFSDPGSLSDQIGKDMADYFGGIEKEYTPKAANRGLGGELLVGAGQAAGMVAPAVVATMAEAPALAVAGGLGLLFGGSSYTEKSAQVKQAGGSDEAARHAGLWSAAVNGLGTTAVSMLTAGAGRYLGKFFEDVQPNMGSVIKNLSDASVMKPFVTGVLTRLAGDAALFEGQGFANRAVDQNYGLPTASAAETAKEALKSAVEFTLAGAPMAAVEARGAAAQKSQLGKALADPKTDPGERLQAVMATASVAKHAGVPEDDIREWAMGASHAVADRIPITAYMRAPVPETAPSEPAAPPGLPAPGPVTVDADGNAMTPEQSAQAAARNAELGLSPDAQRAAAAQRVRESTSAPGVEPLALPAPSDVLQATPEGAVGTSAQIQNAALDERLKTSRDLQRNAELGLTPDIQRILAAKHTNVGEVMAAPSVDGAIAAAEKLAGEGGQAAPGTAQQVTAPALRTLPIPKEAPVPVSTFRNAEDLKALPGYREAKSGDIDAAMQVVEHAVTPKNIEEAKQRFGSGAIFVSPMATEATGHNALPRALAAFYANETGGSVAKGIHQVNRANHTGADPMERLLSKPVFEGAVHAGGKYVLVDDVTSMGGTLAELAHHIQANGGQVAGIVTLANAGRSDKMQAPKHVTHEIERRYGDEVRQRFGIDPAALTANEAGYLIGFKHAVELRARAAKAGRERADGTAPAPLPEPARGVSHAEPTPTPANAGVSVSAPKNRPIRSTPLSDARLQDPRVRERVAADQKAQADAERANFALTGSDRAADVLEQQHAQRSLLDESAAATTEQRGTSPVFLEGTPEYDSLTARHATLDPRIDALTDEQAVRVGQELGIPYRRGEDIRAKIKQEHPDDQERALEVIKSDTQTKEPARNDVTALHRNIASGDDDEAAHVESQLSGKSAHEVADWLVQNAPNDAYREIAAKVADRLARIRDAGGSVEFHIAHNGDDVPPGLYRSRGLTQLEAASENFHIWLNGADVKGKEGTTYTTALHEFVHAATMASIEDGLSGRSTKAKLEVDKLRGVQKTLEKYIERRIVDFKSDPESVTPFEREIFEGKNNAFQNLHELVSWAFTSRDMQELLESIPHKSGSLWTRFVETIRSILGLPSRADTALAEVLKAGERLMDDEIDPFKAAEWQKTTTQEPHVRFKRDFPIELNHKRGDAPDWATTPEEMEAARRAGAWAPEESLQEKLDELRTDFGEKAVQKVFDQFAPLKKLGLKSYVLARLAAGNDSLLEATLRHGTPFINSAGAANVHTDGKGFVGIMRDIGDDPARFMSWIVGNRAQRILERGRLAEQEVRGLVGQMQNVRTQMDAAERAGDVAKYKDLQQKYDDLYRQREDAKDRAAVTERNLSQEQINYLKGLNQGALKDGRSRAEAYQKGLQEFNRYQKAVLDVAESSGIINPESRKMWESEFYVPFYRIAEEDAQVKGPKPNLSGLVNAKGIKRLKGGADALNDPLANTLLNWNHLFNASLRNRAAIQALEESERLGIAEQVPSGTKGSVYVLKDGKEVHYDVSDPYIYQAITALSPAPVTGWPMKVMSKFKHLLTVGTTAAPAFRVAHTLREQLTAVAANPTTYNIVGNWVNGLKLSSKNSALRPQMLAGGSFMLLGGHGERGIEVARLIRDGIGEDQILNSRQKVQEALGGVWQWWKEVGERSDEITRANLYKQIFDRTVAEGGTEDEAHLMAAYHARDVMDFGLRGTSDSLRFLTGAVPFMNARIQGLYKLGRGAVDDPKRFAIVMGAVSLATIALTIANQDDKDIQALPEYVRDSYWAFRIPGHDKVFLLPKPFEVGAMATIADRALEALRNGMTPADQKRFLGRLIPILGSQLDLNPIPQLMRPGVELWANKDFFRGSPIETEAQQQRMVEDRINPGTSLVAKTLGKAGVLSPVQIDHLINAYFGWLGTSIATAASVAAGKLSSEPDAPAWRSDDIPVVGRFVRDLPNDNSRYLSEFYDQQKQIAQIMGSIKQRMEAGDMGGAQELVQEHRNEIALKDLYGRTSQSLTKLNNRIKMIEGSDLPADEKRERMDALIQTRNNLARQMRDTAVKAGAP